jgi:hypothetical protein
MRLKTYTEKFNFGQLTSNHNGKTSSSATAGLYIIAIGGISFIMGCVDKMFLDKSIDIVTQSIIFTGIGAGLLGFRKSKESEIQKEKIKKEDKSINDPHSSPLNS